MEKFMYKVIVVDGETKQRSLHLFESKNLAELFCDFCIRQGHDTILNKWTWKVQIEE